MKTLKIINLIALAIPICLALYSIFDYSFIAFALLSTILTGLLQVIVGVIFWIFVPDNIHIKVYFLGVALFFLFAFMHFLTTYIQFFPIVLALYLTAILYRKDKVFSF